MKKLFAEIKYDLGFVKSHTLQPKWYKVLKIFILLGFLAGYYYFFGLRKAIVFFGCFILLSFVVHMIYRIETKKYTQSWLDFKVVEENHQVKAKIIGIYYYSAIVVNSIISLVISQAIPYQ